MLNFFRRGPRVLKSGPASRVVFFYQGEEGTYVDDVHVKVFENGIVNIESAYEETTTHLQNCEILWKFATQPQDTRASKLRLLRKDEDTRGGERLEQGPPREELQPEE